MKLKIEDPFEGRVFPEVTTVLINTALKSLQETQVAMLGREDGSFLAAGRVNGGYGVDGKVADFARMGFLTYELVDGLLDLNTLTALFISFLSEDDAWKTTVSWKVSQSECDRKPGSSILKSCPPGAVIYNAGPEYDGAKYYIDPGYDETPLSIEEEERINMEIADNLAAARAEIARTPITSGMGDGQLRCSRCQSTSISASQKGYGAGKGLIGAVIAGPIGLLGGFFGSKRMKVTCLNCGHSWAPGSIFQ